jgi:hypothetical protein
MRRYFFFILPTLLVACSTPALPPEAYGIFEDLNDPTFQKRIKITTQEVAFVVGVTLPGASEATLVCRSEVRDGIRTTMQLQLPCQGVRIPFRFEYRPDERDWVVREEDSAPMIFTRRSE